MVFKVFKILFSNIFSLQPFLEGFKKGPKSVIKNIFISLIFVYIATIYVVFYSQIMKSIYQNMAINGRTDFFPLVSLISASAMILFFGFTSVLTNYFTSSGDIQLLSLPLKPIDIFGGKFLVSLVIDSLIGIVIFSISSFIFGYNEGLLKNPLFYIGLIVCNISLSVFCVGIIYFLVVFLLYFCPGLRKKSFLGGISTFFLILFALGYGMLNSQVSMLFSPDFHDKLQKIEPIFQKILLNFSFLSFFAQALKGKIIPILCFILISTFVIFVIVPFLSKFYIESLNGFLDVKTKKLSNEKANSLIKNELKTNSVFKTLFFRDVKIVLREPSFFANGPLMIFLMPLIIIGTFIVTIITNEGSFYEFLTPIKLEIATLTYSQFESVRFYICLICSGIIIFLANSSNIASTAFSREGKTFSNLKSMPIDNKMIAGVKFCHSFLYVFVTFFVILLFLFAGIFLLNFSITLKDFISLIFLILLNSISVSGVLIFIDLFIDTANPKLTWENPTEAFKQNFNSLFGVLITMGIIGIFVVCYILFLPKKMISCLVLPLIFLVINLPLGKLYFSYAEKKIKLL